MSEDCCATGCDVREGSCSIWQWRWKCCRQFLKNSFISYESPNSTNFYQINLFRASFSGKRVPSLTSEPTYFRAPSGLFPKIALVIFTHFCGFFIFFILFFIFSWVSDCVSPEKKTSQWTKKHSRPSISFGFLKLSTNILKQVLLWTS